MTFLPARTRSAPGWDLCTAWSELATMLRGGTGERFRDDGRVPFTVHRSRGSERARLLAAGGRRFSAHPGITAARLPRCGLAVRNRSATRSAAASAWRHWASAFRSLTPEAPSEEPTRSHAVAPTANSGAVRVANRTRGSMFSARRLLGPRLHREEGDEMIIDRSGPEIKWGFWRSDPGLSMPSSRHAPGGRKTHAAVLPVDQREQRRDQREHEPARLDPTHAAREPVGT